MGMWMYRESHFKSPDGLCDSSRVGGLCQDLPFCWQTRKNRILIPFDMILIPVTAIILQAVDSGCWSPQSTGCWLEHLKKLFFLKMFCKSPSLIYWTFQSVCLASRFRGQGKNKNRGVSARTTLCLTWEKETATQGRVIPEVTKRRKGKMVLSSPFFPWQCLSANSEWKISITAWRMGSWERKKQNKKQSS